MNQPGVHVATSLWSKELCNGRCWREFDGKPQGYLWTNPAQRAGLFRYRFFIAAADPSGCDILSHIEEVSFPKIELLASAKGRHANRRDLGQP